MRWRQREEIDGIQLLRVPLIPSHGNSILGRIANYGSFALSASTIGASLIGSASVVYVYHPPATVGLPALVLKGLRKFPFVYHIADMWPESVVESGMIGNRLAKEFVKGFLSSWCRLVYRQAAAITVLSPGFKRLLIERGVPAEKIHVVYNWSDEEVFRPVPRDPALEERLGFRGRFNIVYAGNLGAFQGLEAVIKAAALVKGEPAIQIVLVGTGVKEAELRALAREMKADNVLFVSNRPYWEMPKVNSLADVLLVHLKDLPFFSATIPGKTQISLASGRPILMAVRGDAADLVREAGAGLICEPENPADLARGMIEMSRMPKEQLDEMGARGRAYYLGHLSLDIAGEKMDAIFREVNASWQQRRYGSRDASRRA
jgi:glycosyltransferase involved in cell wall biosynthesis